MDETKIAKLAMEYGLKCDPKNETLEKQADIRQGFIEGMKQALNLPVVVDTFNCETCRFKPTKFDDFCDDCTETNSKWQKAI